MPFINKEYLLEKIHEMGLEYQNIVFSVAYPSDEESKLIITRSMEEMDFHISKRKERNDKIKSLSLCISDEVLQVIDGELWDKSIENNSYNNYRKLCVKMTDCLGRLLQIEIHRGALLSYEIIQPAIDKIVDAFDLSIDQVDFVLNALKKHWQYKDQLMFYANL